MLLENILKCRPTSCATFCLLCNPLHFQAYVTGD